MQKLQHILACFSISSLLASLTLFTVSFWRVEEALHIGLKTMKAGLSFWMLRMAFSLTIATLKSHGMPSSSSLVAKSMADLAPRPNRLAMDVTPGGEYTSAS